MAGKQRLFLPTILTLICAVNYGYAEYKLVCYYTNWSQYRTGIGKFMPKDIDPNLCTHIVYAFGKLVGNQITNFEWNDNDEWSNLYKQVNDLKIKNPKLKTLLAMGGWTAGSLAYSNMVSTKANRKEFIDASIAWCRKYNFDGLDMDWEYPANRDGKPQDYDNFAHFCKETREAFEEEAALTGRKRLLFTSAVAAGKSTIDTAYNVPVMAQYMDFICIMAYDLHGSWEKFTGLHSGYYASDNDSDKTLNVAFAADYWNKKGAPKEKLIIGLGTYGRSFTLASAADYGVGAPASGAGAAGKYTREKGFLAYYEICEMQASGKGTTYRDPKAQVPYYVDPATKLWVGFDDETSLRVKLTDLIINQGYGGAMTWALPLDDFTGTFCGGKKYPLISLMKETLENNGGAPQTTQKPVTAGPTTVKPPTAAPSSANPVTTSKPSSQAPVQTTTTGGSSGFCANKPNGQYVDPTDCSSFYDCWDHAGTVRKCPDGMLFDSVHQWCDCESVVTCDSAVPPTPVPSTPAPSTEMPSTAGPSTAGPISSTDSSNQGNSEYKLVCYYTNWSQYRTGIGKFMPKDIDPNLCTHIVYAFGKLVGNKITNFEWNDNDEWSNLYKQVNDLKVKNPKLKTLLAMGGWTAGSLAYSNMASTKENRKEFIDASIAWCRKYNFDGLDMDWEYPANRDGKPQDYDNFAHLCKETREAFEKEAALTGRKRLLFTSAVAAGKYTIDTAYNVPVMAKYMDFICIMAYDLHGSWEKFTGLHSGYHASDNDKDKRLNVAFAADYWNKKGAPKEKLIIGLGTYGRSFTLASASDHGVGAPASGAGAAGKYTREKGFLAYYEICEMEASGKGTTYRDPKAQVPYYVDPATKLWVGFDDETSLRVKLTDLIIKQGYGGAMTWALPLDDFTGTFCGGKKYPLISLMKETLEAAGNGGTPQTTTKPVTPGPSGAPTSAKPQTVKPPTAKPSTQAPIQTTTTGGNSGFCDNKPNGRYVDPLDCSSYYDCWNKAGTVRKCPDGMLFDSVHQRCDCESVVICDSAVPPSPVPSTSASSTEMPSTARTSTTEPISSTDSSNLRICVRNGAVRDPHDCAQYYECWGGEIIGNVKRCGEGLLFSNVFKGCDYADRVSCDVIGPSSAAPTTRLPVEKTTTPRILETTTTKQRTTPKSGNSKYKLVCYYTNWSQYRNGIGKFMPKDIDPNLCTHIVYAFGKLVGNKITNFEWNDNKWSNLYKQVNDLKLKNPNLKTLIAMGGWTAGSLAYSNMASTKPNRKEFIESSIAWCRKYNFDGLDMDWEYPANRYGRPIDYDNFAHLCKETREAFEEEAALTGRKRLLFTSAVAAGKYTIDTAYNLPVMSKYMDFICIMAYDLHGSWEMFTGLHSGYHASDNDRDKTLNVAFAADYWNKKGAPKEKLVIGLGTYGRSFTLASAANHGVGAPASGAGAPEKYTKEKGFLAYYEICEMQSSGQGTTYRDPKAQVPYYVNPASKLWVGFDDESSLRVKLTDLIIKQGYGGAMTWALPLDDFTGTFCGGKKYPLISLMKETLEAAGNGGVLPITNRPVTAGPTIPNPVTVKPSTAKSSTQAPIQTTTSGGNSGNSKYKLVCYFTNWSQYRTGIGKFMPKDIDPNLCTHIVYAFGKLVGNKITNFEWNDNKWSNLYKQVNDLKLKNPNLKTLLAMGGWTAGSLAYSNMASTKANRMEFIESSIAWCRKYNFDGLDMDWEYPANRDGKPQDYDNFAHLCKETREAFEKEAALTGRKRLLFTSAVAAGKYTIDTAYNVPVMAKYMDFICIMAYDLHGSWEMFTGLHSGYHASDSDRDKTLNDAFAAEYWNKKGAPKEKLIIGLGTYGRSFTLASAANHGVGSPASGAGSPGKYTKEKGFLAYYEICEMQSSGQGTTYRDPKAQVPYYVNPATKLWVGFDDEDSLLIKLKDLIIKQGYGGAMTWALPLDDFTGTFCGGKKYPLISLMKETLENNGGAPQTSLKPITVKPSTAMPSTQAPVKTTTTGGNSGVCVRNGANRDPTDCAQYYECCDGKIIGNVKRCSVGLLFNNIFNRCDYANRVSCDVTGPTSAAPTTKVPEVKTTTPRIMETTSSRQRTTTKSGNICENKLGGLFPHSTDCNKYIQCNYGRPIVRKCGPGLHFNPTVKGCDWPWNAGCQ